MKKGKTVLITSALAVVTIIIGWWYFANKIKVGHINNVLLISIDTCRADHLSCYGYKLKTTPNIDALAQEGILFENAYSPVPMTLPAHCTMLTGTIPPYHGIHDNLNYRLDESNVTIAEILQKKGFATGAAVSTYVLNSQFGINQGFETYNDTFIGHQANLDKYKERKGGETTRVAIEWIEKHPKKPFFYFLHYYDPHASYDPPEPFASKYSDNLYAGEIAYTDHCIGQVIKKLKELNLYNSTLIIIAGDHGEMLGEHGELAHSYFIYQDAIKVPLILKLTGQQKAKRIKDCVGLVDIVPTICSLLDIKPEPQMQGRNLVDYLKVKGDTKNRYLYCESLTPTKYEANTLLGVVANRYKYIQTTRPELYDIVDDPGESNNLVDSEPHRARIMQDKLKQILEEQARKSNKNSRFEMDETTRRRLESLGYVSGGVTEDFSFDQTKKDPKDLIEFHELSSKGELLLLEGNYSEANKVFGALVKQNPDYFTGYIRLAKIARMQNNNESALAYLQHAEKLNPESDMEYLDLGIELAEIGKNQNAIVYYQKALDLNPDKPEILANLGLSLLRLGKVDECITYCNQALKIDPESYEAYRTLGSAFEKQGQLEQAVKSYERSLQIEPNQYFIYNLLADIFYGHEEFNQAIKYWTMSLNLKSDQIDVHNAMGSALMRQNKLKEAIKQYNESLRLNANQAKIHVNLGNILLHLDHPDEAVTHFTKALEIDPTMPLVHNTLADIYFRQGKFEQAIEHWTLVLETMPDNINALNGIAWLKSGYKSESFYNPDEAIKFAQKACKLTDFQDPGPLDTLSVAYAAAGKFDNAVETVQKAIELTHSSGNNLMLDELQKHLRLYKERKAYFEMRPSKQLAP